MLPRRGCAFVLVTILLLTAQVTCVSLRDNDGGAARWHMGTRDTCVRAMRERLRVCHPDTPLPDPPRSLGVHMACKKFGQSCPVDYVHFLEQHLLQLNRTRDTSTSRPDGNENQHHIINNANNDTRHPGESDEAEWCAQSTHDWLDTLFQQATLGENDTRSRDKGVTPTYSFTRRAGASSSWRRASPRRGVGEPVSARRTAAHAALPPAAVRVAIAARARPFPFSINPAWTYEQRDYLENLQRLATVYERRLCAYQDQHDEDDNKDDGAHEPMASLTPSTVHSSGSAHDHALICRTLSAWWGLHVRPCMNGLVKTLVRQLETRWLRGRWCRPPFPALRCALRVTLRQRVLTSLLALDTVCALWWDSYGTLTLTAMLLLCAAGWVAVHEVPEETVTWLMHEMTRDVEEEGLDEPNRETARAGRGGSAESDGEVLNKRVHVRRGTPTHRLVEVDAARSEENRACAHDAAADVERREDGHEPCDSLNAAAHGTRSAEKEKEEKKTKASRVDEGAHVRASHPPSSNVSTANRIEFSLSATNTSHRAHEHHQRRVRAVLFHIMHHYFELEQPRMFLRWRLALYAWTLTFLAVMLLTLLRDVHGFSRGGGGGDVEVGTAAPSAVSSAVAADAGVAVSGWHAWRRWDDGVAGGWSGVQAVTRGAVNYGIGSTTRWLSRFVPTWLVTHVAAVLLLVYMGPLLVIVLRACLSAHTEYVGSQQKIEDYRSDLLYSVL